MDEELKIILSVINAEIRFYIKTYHKKPNYVKVPLWVYSKMENLYGIANTYKSLKICETISITEINEIEVF